MNRTMRVRHLAVTALLAALWLGGPAWAQSPPPETESAEPAPAMVQRLDKQIAALYRRLHITPAQQAPWDGFVQVLRENAAHAGDSAKARAEAGGKTAVEHLMALAAAARSRANDVERLVPAFEALYAAMSPEQRQLADAAMQEFVRRGAGRL